MTLATGIRFGTRYEFPRYVDLVAFGAPGFRVAGDTASGLTAFTSGILLDFGDYVGVGMAVSVGEGSKPHVGLSFSIGSNLRSALTK